MATAKASKNQASTAPRAAIPKGMKVIEGGYAKSWDVEALPILTGKVEHAPKVVTLRQGKKEVERKCMEVRTDDGERYTVWESAGLIPLFENVTENAPCTVWISFRGYGTAKKGQNPPKLFDVAVG